MIKGTKVRNGGTLNSINSTNSKNSISFIREKINLIFKIIILKYYYDYQKISAK